MADEEISLGDEQAKAIREGAKLAVNSMDDYLDIGGVFGVLAAVLAFMGSYICCVIAGGVFFGWPKGILIGLAGGWLPSVILAYIAFWLMYFFWAPVFLLLAILLLAIGVGVAAGADDLGL
jgi:hypothetical protein